MANSTAHDSTNIRKVVLLGADGELGPYMLQQLVVSEFEVTVLKRAGSKSPDRYPSKVKVQRIADDFPAGELVNILKGQDAVVLTIDASQVDLQKRTADACVKAGIKRFIPADFGSCDSATQRAQELVPLFENKTELRDYLTDLANKHSSFTWTALVAGHFFDWLEFVKVFIEEEKINVLDSGDVKASYSTRERVGDATVRVLQRPAKTANKVLFIQSFMVSQNEIVAAFEKATGTKWKVERFESTQYEREQIRLRDEGDDDAIENLVWLLGVLDGNWSKKDGFAMDLLELKDQELNEVVRGLVEEHNT